MQFWWTLTWTCNLRTRTRESGNTVVSTLVIAGIYRSSWYCLCCYFNFHCYCKLRFVVIVKVMPFNSLGTAN